MWVPCFFSKKSTNDCPIESIDHRVIIDFFRTRKKKKWRDTRRRSSSSGWKIIDLLALSVCDGLHLKYWPVAVHFFFPPHPPPPRGHDKHHPLTQGATASQITTGRHFGKRTESDKAKFALTFHLLPKRLDGAPPELHTFISQMATLPVSR